MDVASLMIRVGADTSEAESQLDSLNRRINDFASSLESQGKAMSISWTAPLAAVGGAVFKFGSDFDSAFTGVVKTVDAPAEVLGRLREDILQMSREVPSAATDIARVMELGGQMGIDPDNLTEFTRVIIDLSEATDIVGEQGALKLAQFANVMQMSQEDFDRLGSSIAQLGNNFATTESTMVQFMSHMAGAAAIVGMSEADVAGLAAAYASLGIGPEAGGSSFSRMVVDMNTFVQDGGEQLQMLADIAGMSIDEFSRLFNEDATEALLRFTEGLGDFADEGGNVESVLETLGWKQIRIRRLLTSSSNASDLLREAVEMSNEAWEENIALTREAELRYATVRSQVMMLMNRVRELGIRAFDAARPQIDSVLELAIGFGDQLVNLADGFQRLDPALISAALAFGAVLAAAGPFLLLLGQIAKAVALFFTPLGAVIGVLGLIAAGFAAIKTAAGDNPIASPATLRAIERWPRPLETLARWAIGAGAGIGYLWNAFKDGEDVDPAVMQRLNDTFRMAFGEEATQRLMNAAAAISDFGDKLREAWGVLQEIRESADEKGWMHPDTVDLFERLPEPLQRIAKWGLGAAVALSYVKNILQGDIIGQLWADQAFERLFGEEAVERLRRFGDAVKLVMGWAAGAAIAFSLFRSALTGFTDRNDFFDMWDRLRRIFGEEWTQKIFIAAGYIAGAAAAIQLFVWSAKGMEGVSFEEFTKNFETLSTYLGEDRARGLLTIAGHILAIATGVRILASTGDISHLAEALGDMRDALSDMATEKIQDLKDALSGLSSIGIEYDQETGKLSLDLQKMVQGVKEAFEKAFVGEEATLFDATVITTWAEARKAEFATALNQALGGEDASYTEITPVVKAWASRVKQGIQDTLSLIFGGDEIKTAWAQEIGVSGPMSVDNPVANWVLARKQDVIDALNSAFIGEDAKVFNAQPVIDWVNRQITTIQDEFQKQLTGDTLLGRTANNLIAGFLAIQELLADFDGQDNATRFQTAVEAVKISLDTLADIRDDVLVTTLDTVTRAISNLATAASDFIAGVDADAVTGFVTAVVDELATGIDIVADDERLAKLGEAAGLFAATLITKFGEVLGSDKFGTDLGTKIGQSTGALLIGATALVEGFANQLSNVDWSSVEFNMTKFVQDFLSAFFTELGKAVGEAWRKQADKTMEGGLLDAILKDTGLGIILNRMRQGEKQARDGGGGKLILDDTGLGFLSDFIRGFIDLEPLDFGDLPESAQQAADSLRSLDEAALGFSPDKLLEQQAAIIPKVPELETPVTAQAQAEGAMRLWDNIWGQVQPHISQGVQGMLDWELPQDAKAGIVKAAASVVSFVAENIPRPVPLDAPLMTAPVVTPPTEPVEVDVIGNITGWSDPEHATQINIQDFIGPVTEPVEVPAIPDWSEAVGIVPSEPIDIPVIPDWSGAVGIVPSEPFDVPVTGQVEKVEATGDLDLSFALPGFQQGLTGAASGIQAAANELSAFSFQWPDYPEFSWPELPIWEWPPVEKPSWVWQAIPAPTWLNRLVIPRPSWLDDLLNWRPSWVAQLGSAPAQAPQGLASGTPRWVGGWAMVGEEGPELVHLPRGAAVYPADVSEQMLNGSKIEIVIHATVRGEQDIERLAQRVAEKIRRGGR